MNDDKPQNSAKSAVPLHKIVSWFKKKPKCETYHFCVKYQVSSTEMHYKDGLIKTDQVSFDINFEKVRKIIGNSMSPSRDSPIILSLTKVS